ncbi:hypothetical protein BCR41DRAFT_72552 [Lobosporangium transversale]|uniref:Uncharacterized protein n=1 Tax=Lobosporangium transversale TaxID=64571 RepID=A0A1Y2H1C4_9FUNG|nr:hypothetical protein BCR41DRAFT_72552 [Lobosporangium transversale]ORZ28350.1 hypothetical protein BCR41DRAFT_72552 [Lobosporangium transversale]|eukprot:XP_021886035.1 hypothetical protein BCR41DRAFT_72552 [Lobosporangium transversale]
MPHSWHAVFGLTLQTRTVQLKLTEQCSVFLFSILAASHCCLDQETRASKSCACRVVECACEQLCMREEKERKLSALFAPPIPAQCHASYSVSPNFNFTSSVMCVLTLFLLQLLSLLLFSYHFSLFLQKKTTTSQMKKRGKEKKKKKDSFVNTKQRKKKKKKKKKRAGRE